MGKQVIRVEIYRTNHLEREDEKLKGEYREYAVPYEERMTVLRVLDYVFQQFDRSLAYYKSCRIGKCTGCLVDVNGKNVLACSTLVEEGMRIGPAAGLKPVRDLVAGSPPRSSATGRKA